MVGGAYGEYSNSRAMLRDTRDSSFNNLVIDEGRAASQSGLSRSYVGFQLNNSYQMPQ